MHKYKKEHEYHEQTTTASVLDAVLEIICHNDYKLHRKNPIFDLGSVESLLVVIPADNQGALETMMFESIAENPYDATIVKKAGEFVEEMQASASRYICNNRMKLKSHLGVTWAVQYPEKVFKLMDEQIRSVPWRHPRFFEIVLINWKKYNDNNSWMLKV